MADPVGPSMIPCAVQSCTCTNGLQPKSLKKKLKFKINTLNWGCEAWNSRLDKLDHRISGAFRELTPCVMYCTQLQNHRTLGHTESAELVFAP